ncbi:protein RALF-like 3 [Brassica napus]|uniref:(rape) hypothetical protein n=1 Tax=Brassica napus TaxID=3708 RepID=A0A816U6A4_BRANA|nr:protein RALF-like 3 [Brassica napus]CAF2110026.1 unnamed protein product [Brassica napus]
MSNKKETNRSILVVLLVSCVFMSTVKLGAGNYIGYPAIGSGDPPARCNPKHPATCHPREPANPYTRGCEKFERCQRDSHPPALSNKYITTDHVGHTKTNDYI